MLSVTERTPSTGTRAACSVTVTSRFDEKNRFAGQKVSAGEFASVKYTTTASGDIREVGIQSQDGFEHLFFKDAGYAIREDFSRGKRTVWSLRRVRDAQTNTVLDVRLQCRGGEPQVPVKLDGFLEKSQLYTHISPVTVGTSTAKANPRRRTFHPGWKRELSAHRNKFLPMPSERRAGFVRGSWNSGW